MGGAFTDAVLLAEDGVRTAKVPTSARQDESVLAAAEAVGAEGVERSRHDRGDERAPRVQGHARPLSRRVGSRTCCTCGGAPGAARPASELVRRVGPDGVVEPLALKGKPDRPGLLRALGYGDVVKFWLSWLSAASAICTQPLSHRCGIDVGVSVV